MILHTPEDSALQQLAAEIEKLSPRPHHATLLECVNRLRTDCSFKHSLSRGGWYRPGGVLAADGTRLAENLESWIREQLAACGGNFEEWLEQNLEAGFQVTRHTGRTHYFVASYSPNPTDLLQLEVEETQEVLDRALLDPDNPPQDLQELLEPLSPLEIDAQPVGAPRYRFRRLLNLSQMLPKLTGQDGRNVGIARFLQEWTHSSAADRGHFSEHWVFGLRDHVDRYLNAVTTLQLISRHGRELKGLTWDLQASGTALHAQIQAFDRIAGYPAAWYFHMIATTLVPSQLAFAITKDLEAGFRYLPEVEIALVRDWVAKPYSV